MPSDDYMTRYGPSHVQQFNEDVVNVAGKLIRCIAPGASANDNYSEAQVQADDQEDDAEQFDETWSDEKQEEISDEEQEEIRPELNEYSREQIVYAWAVFMALESRFDLIARKLSEPTDRLQFSKDLLRAFRYQLETYPRPTRAELLSLVDQVLEEFDEAVELWDILSGQGALLMLSDGRQSNSSANDAMDDAFTLIAELRDFIGDLYDVVPPKRLQATLRQVRAILADVNQ